MLSQRFFAILLFGNWRLKITHHCKEILSK